MTSFQWQRGSARKHTKNAPSTHMHVYIHKCPYTHQHIHHIHTHRHIHIHTCAYSYSLAFIHFCWLYFDDIPKPFFPPSPWLSFTQEIEHTYSSPQHTTILSQFSHPSYIHTHSATLVWAFTEDEFSLLGSFLYKYGYRYINWPKQVRG